MKKCLEILDDLSTFIIALISVIMLIGGCLIVIFTFDEVTVLGTVLVTVAIFVFQLAILLMDIKINKGKEEKYEEKIDCLINKTDEMIERTRQLERKVDKVNLKEKPDQADEIQTLHKKLDHLIKKTRCNEIKDKDMDNSDDDIATDIKTIIRTIKKIFKK